MREFFDTLESRRLLATFTVTNTNDSGAGSLRDAMSQSQVSPGADVINFNPGVAGQITLNGTLPVFSDMTINGPGSGNLTISGQNIYQVFKVPANYHVAINGLTVTAGIGDPSGGGINNAGTLSLDDVHVTSCRTAGSSASYFGGGVSNTGVLTITNADLNHNVASAGGGGAIVNWGTLTISGSQLVSNGGGISQGGGLCNFGGATVTSCTFSLNGAASGGAIYNDAAGTLTINAGTIANNGAADGGGLYNAGGHLSVIGTAFNSNTAFNTGAGMKSTSGVVHVSGASFFSNIADQDGGGIDATGPITIDAAAQVTNFNANQAKNGHNGGAINHGSGQLTMDNVSFTGNTAAGNGGAVYNHDASALLSNTSFFNNGAVHGGGIYQTAGTLSITSSLFQGDTASGNGGNVFAAGAAVLTSVSLYDGAAQRGGGVYASDFLTLNQCIVDGNSAADNGGGVEQAAFRLTVNGSTISNNSSASYGGGACVESAAALTMTGATIRQNTARYGGGVWNGSSDAGIWTSTIASNTANASGFGGGVGNGGVLTIDESTISGNTSVSGGGVSNVVSGVLTVSNSTIAGNSAGAGHGGGIQNSGGTTTLLSSTMSGNSASLGGGIYASGGTCAVHNATVAGNTGGAGMWIGVNALTMVSTIVAGNSGGDIIGDGLVGPGSVNNLVQDAPTAGGLIGSVNGNLIGVNPLLGTLASNGGSTQTMALSAGSPAIGKGSNPDGRTTDQRLGMFARGVNPDIGAYQRQSFALVVDTLLDVVDYNYSAGHLSLREAVSAAGPNPGNDTITFAPALNGAIISLSVGKIDLFGDMTITGPGAALLTISGAVANYGFDIKAGAVVVMSGITFDHLSTVDGGAAFYNAGSLTLTSSTVSGNSTGLINSGTMTLAGCTVSGNSLDHATEFGGILNYGTLTIANSTVTGNGAMTLAGWGGGIKSVGALTVRNSTISGNPGGGGIAVAGGTATLISTIVSGNAGGDIVAGTLAAGSVNNLVQDAAHAGGLVNGESGNIVGVDPLLAALANNGGPTKTMALLAGSPAINKGSNPGGLTTDQRGGSFGRVRGSGIDIGAFEFSGAPTVVSLTPSTPSVARGQSVRFAAVPTDPDGSVVRVDFYRDANNNGVADNGELIGSDSNGADGFSVAFGVSIAAALGNGQFLALATDDDGITGVVKASSLTVVDALPSVTSLTPSAGSVARGQNVALSATSTDTDGTIVRVDFYRDANNNGLAEPSELIGTDSNGADGFSVSVGSTLGLPVGDARFFAVATDNDGGQSAAMAALITMVNVAPTLGTLTSSASSFGQGDPVTLTAGGGADADGSVVSVRFYADVNRNGVADPSELLGSDSNGADGFALTLSGVQTDSLPTGAVQFLAAAVDNDGEASSPAAAGATTLFSVHVGSDRLVSGTADNTDASRVVSVNPSGHVIVFEQGWSVADLQAKTVAPVASGDAVIWVDPKDNLTYVAAPSAGGLLLFTRSSTGAWTFRNLTAETGAMASPTHGLTQFTSVGGVVVVAGITADGSIVAFQQTLGKTDAGGPAFKFVDISGDLASQGMTTPQLTALISYVPTWDSWHMAGIDGNGRIQSVWIAPATFTRWRTDDLSAITGAPAAQGQLAVTLTSWGGINLSALNSGGNLLTTWWVPSFGGIWNVNDLTAQFHGTPLSGGKVSGYTTPWGGLNYVGLANDGKVMVYWWSPGLTDWNVSPLLPDSVPAEQRPTGTLNSSSSAAGTLSVYGRAASGDALRMWWKPSGAATWAVDDVSAVAARV